MTPVCVLFCSDRANLGDAATARQRLRPNRRVLLPQLLQLGHEALTQQAARGDREVTRQAESVVRRLNVRADLATALVPAVVDPAEQHAALCGDVKRLLSFICLERVSRVCPEPVLANDHFQ